MFSRLDMPFRDVTKSELVKFQTSTNIPVFAVGNSRAMVSICTLRNVDWMSSVGISVLLLPSSGRNSVYNRYSNITCSFILLTGHLVCS